MVTLTAINASPSNVAANGGTATLTPVYTNPSSVVTVRGVDENGTAANVTLSVSEAVSFVVVGSLPAQAPPGQILFALDPSTAGTLSVDPGGATLTFTAA